MSGARPSGGASASEPGADPGSGRSPGWALILEAARLRRRGFALAVGAGLVWALARVLVPLLVKTGIDRGIRVGDTGATLRWAGAIALAGAVAAACTGARRYFAFGQARWVEAHLRERLFAHVQRLHFGYHDRTPAGELMSRASTDLQQVQGLLFMLPVTVSNLVIVAAAIVVLFVLDPLLAPFALCGLPLVNWLGRRFALRLHPSMLGLQRESAQLAAVVEESIAGVRVVKGFGAEEQRRGALRREADDVFAEAMTAARTRSVFNPLLELIPNLGLIAVLAVGGIRVIDGHMTLGALVAFNAYVTLLVWPLRELGMIIAWAQRALASAGRVAEVMAERPQIVAPPAPLHLPDPAPDRPVGRVAFEGVRFAYAGPGDEVLDGLDLAVGAGESLALVGETGSGKSTVARLLARFYDVAEGRVCLDGVDVRRLDPVELRRAVGVVFEDTFLFADTVAANIAFAEPDASAERIEAAARLAGAHEFITSLPEGYQSVIGERGYSLSGGQRQRIAIARALLADPRVLVLDDATSAVDPTKEHEIRDALRAAMSGRTTIVIAHRPATIALADRVALLDRGRVAALGGHRELLASSARYRPVLASAAAHASAAAAGRDGERDELGELEVAD
ncbi:MAG: ABC transporter ATP-binding protein [Acidimicrobiales bacterium]